MDRREQIRALIGSCTRIIPSGGDWTPPRGMDIQVLEDAPRIGVWTSQLAPQSTRLALLVWTDDWLRNLIETPEEQWLTILRFYFADQGTQDTGARLLAVWKALNPKEYFELAPVEETLTKIEQLLQGITQAVQTQFGPGIIVDTQNLLPQRDTFVSLILKHPVREALTASHTTALEVILAATPSKPTLGNHLYAAGVALGLWSSHRPFR